MIGGETNLAASEVLSTSQLQGLLHDGQPTAQTSTEEQTKTKGVPGRKKAAAIRGQCIK